MKLTYESLGKYVRLVDERNVNMDTEKVIGINIDKFFMPSVANVIGTDLSNYKLLRNGRFACNPMHVGRDGRLPVARYTDELPAIVSPAYFMFEIVDDSIIEPEYLMFCFRRPDFDRMCWFRTDASVRGGITWEDVCALTIPIPSISEQRRIVSHFNVVSKRIDLLKKINNNIVLECETLYKRVVEGNEANAKFSEIVHITSGKRNENTKPGTVPLLGAGGIMDYISDYNFLEPALIIGRVGTHGIVQRSDCFWASDNTLVIIPQYYEFAFHFLRSIDYATLNRGSTQPLITQGDLNMLDIYIPDKATLNLFESTTSKFMRMYSDNEKEIALLSKVLCMLLSKF